METADPILATSIRPITEAVIVEVKARIFDFKFKLFKFQKLVVWK